MIERLVASCRTLGRPMMDCQHSLAAYEVDVASAGRARELVIKTLIRCGVGNADSESLASAWVRTADYLFEADSLEADFVIGNPPYIRLEDIPEETATLYREAYSTMRGRADLYVAFFEAALSQLKNNGVCAFICADRWMRNQYGAELRQLVTSAYSIDVVVEMHNADAFHDDVDAYPAITVIRRKRQGVTVVASAGAEAVKTRAQTLAATLESTWQGAPLALPRGLKIAAIDKWFKDSDPWPCNSPEQLTLLRKLEDQFHALESDAKVGIGVATGNDGVFITKDTEVVEPSRLLKLALVGDISSGKLEWSGHYLIDPWNSKGLADLEKYPRMKAYFEEHGAALRRRHTAKNHKTGWYKTIDRVTHALTQKPKLY
ncbi:MAG: Eco57I restriction-modification methylase domain-containing protein, partial [Bryobacteraceae bacterium]